MTELFGTPAALFSGVVLMGLIGGGIFSISRLKLKVMSWICGIGFFLQLVLVLTAWNRRLNGIGTDAGLEPLIRGWVLPRESAASLLAGVSADALTLGMLTLLTGIGLTFLLCLPLFAGTRKMNKVMASLALSSAGAGLAWLSVAPALSFFGAALSVISGPAAFAPRWENNEEADQVTRSILEKTSGLVIAWVGICILAGGRTDWDWVHVTASGENGPADTLGSILLISGIFMQFHAFPFLGWPLRSTENHPLSRVLFNQVYPAWALFPILLRTEPLLRARGVFHWVGAVALLFALLTAAAGMMQRLGRISMATWISAGFALGLALLAFAGPAPAFFWMVNLGLMAILIAAVIAALDLAQERGTSTEGKLQTLKVLTGIAVASGCGFAGFASFGGITSAVQLHFGSGATLASLLLVHLFFCVQGWGLFWRVAFLRGRTGVSWLPIVAMTLWVLFGIGFFWSGTWSGWPEAGSAHPVLQHLLEGTGSAQRSDGAEAGSTVAVLAVLFIGWAIAWWLTSKEYGVWDRFRKAAPQFTGFLQEGYRIDASLRKMLQSLIRLGIWVDFGIEKVLVQRWILGGSTRALSVCSDFATRGDLWMMKRVHTALARGVEWPARFVQWLQNGDVQWYLLMAMGSGLLLAAVWMKL